ncbi:MAG TPA: TIGR03960 family B12-binding radical SAM protein, partial [Clostridiaceae bacterium]|nr:TIGR03960 family B12-binding radical SAM protein [Clostridiaceae bacterium]
MKLSIPRDILRQLEKPAQYLGGEWNQINKSSYANQEDLIKFAFCFPDIYEIGMSNLALRIIYDLINKRSDAWCERVFAPAPDLRSWLKAEKERRLFSLESGRPLADFDIVGFTLQYELSYTAILDMLDLAGIPQRAMDRRDNDPFVWGGGPLVVNVEPMADFFDLFMLGEGEDMINSLLDLYQDWRQEEKRSKEEFLLAAARIPGVYVPAFYDVSYHEDGSLAAVIPNRDEASAKIRRQIIEDLDQVTFPEKQIVPFLEIVHDRIYLEIFRGCPRGCRFCQAGMIYRPVRERSLSRLTDLASRLYRETGYGEIGLLSLSSSDYSQIDPLTVSLVQDLKPQKVNISLPSLRLDSFDFELMTRVAETRKAGLTFAPEAGTQRLRDVINKNITDMDLHAAAEMAFKGGWNRLKLYFMLGLPTETEEDVEAIATLTFQLLKIYGNLAKQLKLRKPQITVSTAMFIPKPFTPFQWVKQESPELMRQHQSLLASRLRSKVISYQWHDIASSIIEAVLARGDRRLGAVILRVWQAGSYRESWREGFDLARWQEAMSACSLSIERYTGARDKEEVLPWDHLDMGVDKDFLWAEYEKALRGETTEECRQKCNLCGAESYHCGICFAGSTMRAPKRSITDQYNDEGDKSATESPEPLEEKSASEVPEFRIRLEYSRQGAPAWLGHLDMMRTMERLFKRADLALAWTEGFNPRPQLVFALPAGVGVELKADICELVLTTAPPDPEQLLIRLNAVAPGGIAFGKI